MKKRQTQEQKFLALMKSMGVKTSLFNEEQYIYSEAVKKGAVRSYTVGSDCDFNFTAKGKFVGVNSSSINSFQPPVKKVKK